VGRYIIIGVIGAGFIFYWLISSVRKEKIFGVYIGGGIALCLTLLITENLFGLVRIKTDILVPKILGLVGNFLVILASLLVILSFIALKLKGKPETGIEDTTVFINSGIYRVIRHPLYLGFALWSIGLTLQSQSISSTILGTMAFLCFWIGSAKEEEFNVRKFGNKYKEYIKRVPRWNVLKRDNRLEENLICGM